MKLASYLVDGQSHYGVIQPNGDVIDLSTKIGPEYASLLQLIQKNGFEAARAVVASAKQADRSEASLHCLLNP
jgi:hypothetical protein